GGAQEGAPRDRTVIGLLRLLQRVERRGMLALPFEPHAQAGDRVGFGGAGALDAEGIAGVFAACARNPVAVTLACVEAIVHKPNRAGLTAASAGSIVFSSIASATSCAVS